MNLLPQLRIVSEEAEQLSITQTFQQLGKILPEDQRVVTVPPDMQVSVALELMRKHGFSQLPVMIGRQVLGVFSYRSFADAVIKMGDQLLRQKLTPGDLEVEECMETPVYAQITDEFRTWFDTIDTKDAILIGRADRLQGVLTAMDILRYLYGVASPFVMFAEIELSLRALIRTAVDDDTLRNCCDRSLKHYTEEERPYQPELMSFGDYVSIVGDGRNWDSFHPVFRGNRVRTRAKLEELRDLRNAVFHFRRELQAEEYERLVELRDWMLGKAVAAEAAAKGAMS